MRHLATLALLFGGYVVAAKIGLSFATVHPSATAIWPPTGIALAAFLLLGRDVWPAIFVGAFVVNVTTAGSVGTSLGISVGNTLEAQDIFKLAALAAVGSTAVSATIGVASLALSGYAAWQDAGFIWLTWWLGDASGILLLTPLIVLWGRRSSDPPLQTRRFLAMLSHELRNPLGAIGSAIQLLERVTNPTVAARAQGVIARQTQHLSRLVEDLLDVSRAVTGKIALQREVVDLAAIADRAVAGLVARHAERARDISLDARPVRVLGDAVRLEQVVNNLLENAMKYTPAGGPVVVTVGQDGDNAVLAVADTGVGIAPELLPRIFDLFVQADRSLERTAGGLGIGLTLVRQIVELHGGTVQASSNGAGQGSRFTVRLPVTDIAVPTAAAGPAPGGRRHRILVIEDNEDAREMLGELIRVLGHEIHAVADGMSAVETALRLLPDLTLVDIGLPGVDGYEIARRIRGDPRGQRLRLVALTGYGRSEDRERALACGYDDHIVKPVDQARLATLLGEALDKPPSP